MGVYFKKMCTIVLALCMLIGILPVSVLAEDSVNTRIVSQQLSLGDDLTMRFYAQIESSYIDDAVMTVATGGNTATYAIKNMAAEKDGTYLFSTDLAAAQMTESINLTLVSGGTEILSKTYSIQDYAISLLQGNYTNETKALVREMLNYGAKAQLYFDYKTDDLANTGYTTDTTAKIPEEIPQIAVNGRVSGITYYGAAMVFESKLAVRYYFAASSGVDGYTFAVGENTYKPEPKDGLYYIEVPGINPQDMDTLMEVAVTDGTDTLTISYSPMHYITRMYSHENSSDALKELLQAAYDYYTAAKAFTGVKKYYIVSFSDGVASQTILEGDLLEEPTISKDGYRFLGWYAGDTLFDFTQPITGDVALNAKWEAVSADLWNDFRDESSANVGTADAKLTWQESYEGASGVLKIQSPATQSTGNVISTSYADVWSAPASTQILASESASSYADVRTDTVYLDAARNEYETGQIIVSSKSWLNLSFTVSVSDLVHSQYSTAVITSDNCTVYTQKYVSVSNNLHGNDAPTGDYPDSLLPQENAIANSQNVVKYGKNGGAWLSFYIPADAVPGTYSGTATVTLKSLSQTQVTVPISLTVYDVAISDETTSKSLFTINTTMLEYYEQDSTGKTYDQYVQFLIDHRLAPSDIRTMTELAEDGDSSMRVWAKTVWYWYEKGLRTIPLKANLETDNGYACCDMDTVKECLVELAKLSQEKGVNLLSLTALYDWPIDEPFYITYSAEHIQHNIDLFDETISQTVTELAAMDGFDTELGQSIIESVKSTPHIITDYYGNEYRYNAPMVYKNGMAFSYADQNVALCPKFNDYNTQDQRAQYDLVGNAEKWWYGCNEPEYPYPSYHTDDTPVSAAAIGWMMADYGITGNLMWAINYSHLNGAPVSDPYSVSDWGSGALGDGCIVYPGRTYGVNGPVGTIRTSAILDGNEDYELIRYVQALYKAQGLSADGILKAITADVYSGTKVYGDSASFETARKVLLYVAEKAAAGVFFSNASLTAGSNNEKCYSLTVQGSNNTEQLYFSSGANYVGNTDGTVNWVPFGSQRWYEDVIALTFRLWVSGGTLDEMTVYGYDGSWRSFGKLVSSQSATSGWTECTLSVDMPQDYDALSGMFLELRSDADITVYIDRITVVRGYTVSFSDGIPAQKIRAGSLASEPANPIKPGYVFLGWYNNDTLFDFSQTITGDTTLIAKWKEIPADVWNDFYDSATAGIDGNGATVSWLESYEGKDGVLKIVHNSGHKWMATNSQWSAVRSVDAYADVTALKFRARLEDDSGSNMLYIFCGGAKADGSDLYEKVFEGLTTTDGWTEFTVTLDVPTYYSALNNMQLHYWSGDGSTLYIDEITVVRTPLNMWNDFSDSSCASVWHYDIATLTWLESYNGAQGVFKIENSGGRAYIGNTNGINWGAVRNGSAYEGAEVMKFRVLLEDDSGSNLLEAWYKGGSGYKMVFSGLTSTDGWTEFTIPFDPETEYDLMNGMFFQYWSDNGGTLYIDQILAGTFYTVSFSDGVPSQSVQVGTLATAPVVSKDGYYFKGWYNGEEKFDFSTPITSDITLTAKWEEIPADMWNDFSASTTANIDGNGTTVTWLESYEDEDGVLKIEHNSDHKWINTLGNWPAVHSADSYAYATALKLRLRLEDNEGGNMLYLFSKAANADGSDLYVQVFDGVVTTNGWVEYTIPLDVPAYYDALHNLQLHYWSGDGSTLYIDEITVVLTPMNMWNDFGDSSCASVWHYDNATLSWLESYNGAQGVFKIENSGGRAYVGNTDGINWGAVRDASVYEGATALKFRILLEDDSDGNQLEAWYRGSSNYKMVFTGLTSTDGWTEFTVPFDPATEYDLMDGMYFQYWSGNGGTVYIDEITVVHTPMNVWNDFSASTTANIDGNGATVTWLESYEGEDGVLKIQHNSGHKWIATNGNWPAEHSVDLYADVVALKLRLRLEDNEGGNMLYLFSQAANADGSDLYVKVFDGVVTTNGWVEYIISLNVPAYYDALHNLQLHYWSGDGSTLYIDEITVVYSPKEIWNDFSDSSCASVWHYDIATLTWLESYVGAEGVFKIENSGGRAYIGNTNGINWGAVYEMSEYEGATGLKFRVLLEDDSDGNQLEAWYRGGSGYEMVFTGLTSTDGWTEFTIPFDPATQFDLMDGMFFQYWSGNGGTLYIDQITTVTE